MITIIIQDTAQRFVEEYHPYCISCFRANRSKLKIVPLKKKKRCVSPPFLTKAFPVRLLYKLACKLIQSIAFVAREGQDEC